MGGQPTHRSTSGGFPLQKANTCVQLEVPASVLFQPLCPKAKHPLVTWHQYTNPQDGSLWAGGPTCIAMDRESRLYAGRSLRDQIFFLLRTVLKDRPKGPPTANRQLPPTANRHQLPTATNRQPPTATNHQPSTAANRHQPPITNCQLPPTAANRRQPPTANRQSPPATNCQSPPTMVEHMSYTRSFLKKPCTGTVFFSPLRTALPVWVRRPQLAMILHGYDSHREANRSSVPAATRRHSQRGELVLLWAQR